MISIETMKHRTEQMVGEEFPLVFWRGKGRVVGSSDRELSLLVRGMRADFTWDRLTVTWKRFVANHTLTVDELGGGHDAVGIVSLFALMQADALDVLDADGLLVLKAPERCMASFYIGISQGTAFPMFVIDHQGTMPEGEFEIVCKLGYLPLPKGHYSLWTAITGFPKGKKDPYLPWQPLVSFEAFGPDRMEPPEGVMALSPVYVGATWDVR